MAGKLSVRTWFTSVAALLALSALFLGCRFDDTSIEQRACAVDDDCLESGPSYRCVGGLCVTGNLTTGEDATLDVPNDGESETSSGLACGNATCVTGESCCDFQCIDPQTDDANCGGCGLACSAGETCLEGICTCGDSGETCGIGRLCCPVLDSEGNTTTEASCRTVQSDPNNCGVCGVSCSADELCLNGLCVCEGAAGALETCGDSDICCPGRGCANVNNDPQNCGGCGISCGLGESCVAGVCTCGTDEGTLGSGAACGVGDACCGETGQTPSCLSDTDPLCSCGGASCQLGEACCGTDDGDACIDTKRDASHCGGCGVECAAGEACVSSACVCQQGFDDCDGNAANGCETTPATDFNNCGECGNECEAGAVCFNGECVTNCQDNLTNCSGSCVNTNTDTQNCGGCGTTCSAGEKCSSGNCQTDCQEGLNDCGGNCVNFQTDKFNCGACGRVCDAGQFCSNGACVFDCPSGQVECGGSCISPGTDQVYCGAKGTCDTSVNNSSDPDYGGETCAAGQLCSGGSCVSNCPTGQVPCSGGCVDLNTDRAHCGACGDACGPGQVCTGGECQASCPTGQTFCSPNCVDTDTNRLNCGECNKACPDGQVCSGGSCTTSCASGFVNCEGTCIDPDTDLSFCGANSTCSDTGEVCDPGERCIGGACQLDCATGTVNCGGACINPNINRTYCGATLGGACNSSSSGSGDYQGVTCADGELCSSGNCVDNCPAGQIPCQGTCIDVTSDAANCGACGNPCEANQECVKSTCQCVSGFAECDSVGTNGCESFTPADPNNCGANAACENGNICTTGEACVSGSCECAAGLVRCGGICIDPRTNNTYCGATSGCGVSSGSDGAVCGNGERCEGSVCTCAPGLVECAGDCIDPDTDSTFCGATAGCGASGGSAGTDCGDAEVCFNSNCISSCPTGQTLCADGCTNTDTDASHCGNCASEADGVDCVTSLTAEDVDVAACQAGSCLIVSCATNTYDCNGTVSDGCESSSPCDTASCSGNGAEAGEVCDGSDLNGQTCASLGYDGEGSTGLQCNGSCNGFDTSDCTMNCPTGTTACGTDCVDTTTDPVHCGGCNDNGGANCTTLTGVNSAAGSTACISSACVVLACATGENNCDGDDTNGCETTGSCTCDDNGTAEAGESCDGSDLRGLDCTDFGYASGTLACTSDGTCAYDTSSCSGSCSNSTLEPDEVCDGSLLGGLDCTDFGFDGGTLGCNGTCDGYDTSACTCGGVACAPGTACISGVCYCGTTECTAVQGSECTWSSSTCECIDDSGPDNKCDEATETCDPGNGCITN